MALVAMERAALFPRRDAALSIETTTLRRDISRGELGDGVAVEIG